MDLPALRIGNTRDAERDRDQRLPRALALLDERATHPLHLVDGVPWTALGGLDLLREDHAVETGDRGADLGATDVEAHDVAGARTELVGDRRSPHAAGCPASFVDPAGVLELADDLRDRRLRDHEMLGELRPRDGPELDDRVHHELAVDAAREGSVCGFHSGSELVRKLYE